MTEPADNLVLEHLRYMRSALDGVREDMREVKTRIGRLEVNLAQTQLAIAEQSVRLDRLDGRIEKRLDLAEA
jgi:hypothetical protein